MKELEALTAGLIDSQTVSFLGSVDEAGFPQIRAMLRPRKRVGIYTIYFSTNTPTNKVRHYRQDQRACVYVCDPLSFQGVLLTGTMEVLEDQKHKELLWRPGDEVYYPGGVTDPDYCVLRFTSLSGRAYGNFRSESFVVLAECNREVL